MGLRRLSFSLSSQVSDHATVATGTGEDDSSDDNWGEWSAQNPPKAQEPLSEHRQRVRNAHEEIKRLTGSEAIDLTALPNVPPLDVCLLLR